MKTTKVILVAALMAFATIGFAQSEATPKNVKSGTELSALISLKTAMQNRGLIMTMRAELSPRFLIAEQPSYTVMVKYKKVVYYIYGSYSAWKHFFSIKRYPTIKSN